MSRSLCAFANQKRFLTLSQLTMSKRREKLSEDSIITHMQRTVKRRQHLTRTTVDLRCRSAPAVSAIGEVGLCIITRP